MADGNSINPKALIEAKLVELADHIEDVENLKDRIAEDKEELEKLNAKEAEIRAQLLEAVKAAGGSYSSDLAVVKRMPGKDSLVQTEDFDINEVPIKYTKTETKTTVVAKLVKAALTLQQKVPGYSLKTGDDYVSVEFK